MSEPNRSDSPGATAAPGGRRPSEPKGGLPAFILSQVADAVIALDMEYRVTYWGPGAEKLYGKTAAQMLGRHMRESHRPRWLRPEDENVAVDSVTHLGSWRGDIVHVLQNGEERYVEVSVSRLQDAHGKMIGALTVNRDISERRKMEESLRLSEERFRVALDATGTMVYEYNVVTRRFESLHGIERLVGYTADEIEPTFDWWNARIHPEDLARCLDARSLLLNRSTDLRYSMRVRHKDGRWLELEAFGRPLLDETGKIVRIVGTVSDVTEKNRASIALQRSEERLQQAQLAAHLGAWEYDHRTGRCYWSEPLWRLYGLEPRDEAFPRESWMGLIFPEDRPIVDRMLSGTTEGHSVLDFRIVLPDGQVRWVASRWSVVRDAAGKAVRSSGTNADITRRKQLEEALREEDRRKDEFIAVLSHELRTPLTPLRASLHLLSKDASMSERSRRSVAMIDRQTRHLTRLVDDLLDVTRISQRKIRLRPSRIDLVETIRRCVADHQSTLTGHEVTIALPDRPLPLDGDEIRLTQVVANLLENAVKFTPEGGKISLRLDSSGGRAELKVSDTGIGIEPGELGEIFSPFIQLERSLERSRGGLGLGLSLAKAIVELHGGEVSVESQGPGRGTCFTVRLPLASAAVASTEAPRPVVVCQGPTSVLVIDDDADTAESLRDVLVESNFDVSVAFDGLQGLERARHVRPDVILCDIGLPRMDGYAFARAVRQEPELASTYLVALTGYAQKEDVDRAKAAGFDTHLAKPPDLNNLEALLRSLNASQPLAR